MSALWLGVDLTTTTKKTMCLKEIGLCAHNTLTILGSIVSMVGGS